MSNVLELHRITGRRIALLEAEKAALEAHDRKALMVWPHGEEDVHRRDEILSLAQIRSEIERCDSALRSYARR